MVRRALHIGIDGRELLGKPTGVGRYLLEVLRVWATESASAHRYTIFVPSEPAAALQALGDGLAWHVVAAPAAGTWWEQTHLATAVRRAGPDVFFAAGYTAPYRLGCPMVAGIYDVSFFAHPEWFSTREGVRRRWLTRATARRARTIVTISEFSAREIVRWLRVARGKIVIAPPAATARPAPTHDARQPVVLFVGSLFNRRQIPLLLDAFALAARRRPDARLILVGDNRTSPRIDPRAGAERLGIGGRVEWREYVDEDELERLYSRARVFVFLSEYEGFAMTPLEAIAHGAPPILLDTEVAREVYGDGARYVMRNATEIADALVALLSDDGAHAALVAAGRQRLAAFSWTRTAHVIQQALEGAATRR